MKAMYKKLVLGGLAIAFAFGISSCKLLNPSIMLKTPKNYTFDIPPDTLLPEYKIAPGDHITFQLFANDGFRLIDMANMTGAQQGGGNAMFMMMQGGGFRYLIDYDGKVKLPILGRVQVAGYTRREAELMLQELYSDHYIKPFVLMNVVNRRVLVFPGTDGAGIVVPLLNENMTLMEALATAGGLTLTGKAHKIKLVRDNITGNPKVYLIDLSTIEGLDKARMVLQANDIIYVEPRVYAINNLLREVTPILSLISSTLLLIVTIRNLQNSSGS